MVAFMSSYQLTVKPFPPLMVFSKLAKSKIAMPVPSSHKVFDAGLAGRFPVTVSVIEAGAEMQFPLAETA